MSFPLILTLIIVGVIWYGTRNDHATGSSPAGMLDELGSFLEGLLA